MSDLTITHGGVSATKKSAGEVLSRMKVTLIDADLTTVAAAVANDEVVSQSIELTNAVAITGGTGIIQSVTLNSDDAETPAMDLIFTQVNNDIASAPSATVGDDEDIDSITASVLGFVSLANYTNLVDSMTVTATNIGLVVKAASDTTSIWVHLVNRSGGNFTPTAVDDLHVRVGIVQD